MTKVTDPDILKQLNEGTDQPAEKPKGFMERHPQFAQDVSDLGSVAKGVARSAANTAGAIFSADEWLNRKITGQPTPPADPAITAIREFGNAPNANVPESFGYWGGEAAQAIGSTPSAIAKGVGIAAKGAAKFGGKVAFNEALWHAAGAISSSLGIPIWPIYMTLLGLPRGAKGLFKGGAKEAAEEAGKGAAKEAATVAKPAAKPAAKPWGEAPAAPKTQSGVPSVVKKSGDVAAKAEPGARETAQEKLTKPDVPPTGKPRVRVPAGSRTELPGKFPWDQAAE